MLLCFVHCSFSSISLPLFSIIFLLFNFWKGNVLRCSAAGRRGKCGWEGTHTLLVLSLITFFGDRDSEREIGRGRDSERERESKRRASKPTFVRGICCYWKRWWCCRRRTCPCKTQDVSSVRAHVNAGVSVGVGESVRVLLSYPLRCRNRKRA